MELLEKMVRQKIVVVHVELKIPETLSREQISDEVMKALKKYKPFVEDVDGD